MNNESLSSMQLVLSRDDGGGKVSVPLEPFLGFDLWVTHDLEELTDRWSDFSPPAATQSVRRNCDEWGKWDE